MGDLFGLIIVIFIAVYIYFSSAFRCEKRILILAFVLFAVRVGVAAWNGFVGPTLGADSDALDFYKAAINLKNSGIIIFGFGTINYIQFLSFFMRIGESIFLASLLSVVAFIFSAKQLLDICDYCNRGPFKFHILLAFGFLPSMILFGSVMLREAFQILFFISAIKFFVIFYIHKKLRYYFLGLLSLFLMGSLHEGLLVVAVLLIPFFTIFNYTKIGSWPLYSKSKLSSYFLLIGFAMVSLAVIPFIIRDIAILNALNTGDINRYASNYRESLMGVGSRSTYFVSLDTSSLVSSASSMIVMLIYYLFYPFPWKIAGFFDTVAFFEVVWRAILIFFSIRAISIAKGKLKNIYLLLFLACIVMASVWSLGTTNVGQSLRHNILTYWILLVLGIPNFIIYTRRSFKFALKPKLSTGR